MIYKLTADVLQSKRIRIKDADHTDIKRHRSQQEEPQTKREDHQDYIVVTLEWGPDDDKTIVTAKTNGAKFREIVEACAALWQRDIRTEAHLKQAGQQIAELLRGRSYTTAAADSVRGYLTATKTPLDVLTENLTMPNQLDHIMIVSKDPTLEELPWELLTIDDQFISLSESVRLFRLHQPQTPHEKREGAIDLEIFNINMGQTPLALGKKLYDKIAPDSPPEEFTVQSLTRPNITRSAIRHALEEEKSFSVFHFAGHGDLIHEQRPALCVSDDKKLPGMNQYQVAFIEPHDLTTYLTDNRFDPPLIVCACCQSGIGKNSTGFGTEMINRGAAAVVGMQAPVHDESANTFTSAFYKRLNNRNDIVSAIASARRQVALLPDPTLALDWWIPTLHATRIGLVFEQRRSSPDGESIRPQPHEIVRQFREQAEYEQALGEFRRLERQQQRNLAPDDPDRLATRNARAIAYRDAGDLRKSLRIDSRLLRDQQRIFGDQSSEVLSTRRRMAMTLTESGNEDDLRRALEHEKAILEIQESRPGKSPVEALRTQKSIASLHTILGESRQALAVEEKLLDARTQILGEDDPATLTSRHDIADLHRKLGNFVIAHEMETTLLEDRSRILTPQHPDTLTSRNNLAISLWKRGRFKESYDVEAELLADRKEILGWQHPDTIRTRDNLCVSLWELGDHREALDLTRKVLSDRQEFLPNDHDEIRKTQTNLAEMLCSFGKLDEALRLQNQILSERRERHGKKHRLTLMVWDNLAITLRALGRYEDALRIHTEINDMRRNLLDKDPEHELISKDAMAIALRLFGRLDEALQTHEEVLGGLQRQLPADHPALEDTRHNLAIVFRDMGQLNKAIALQDAVHIKRRNALGIDHPKTLVTRYEISRTLARLGELRTALEIGREVLERQEQRLGATHPDSHRSRIHIADVLAQLGRFDDR